MAPIRLYLVAAAIFFLIWPLAAEARAAYFEALVRDIVVNALLEAGAEVAIAEAERWQRTMANRIVSALKYLLLLASVPLLAVINRGEWGKDTESLVLQLTFSLHFHAVALFVLALAILLGELWSGFQNTTWAPVLLIAYLALALRGAFATTWRVAVIRSITLYVAFGFAAVVVTLGYAAAAALLWG